MTSGFAVVEGEGDDRGIEAGVERVEDGARHRYPVVGLQHRRRVGEHHRDRIAARNAVFCQRRSEPSRARVDIFVGRLARSMNNGRILGEDLGAALQEQQRRERLEVGAVAVEIGIVGVLCHGGCPAG